MSTIVILIVVLVVAYRLRPINKEKYMDTLKGLSRRPYMGIVAITNNPGDLFFCAMVALSIVGYILYRGYMDHRARTNKRACMRRAMRDYSYSTYLVRMLEEEK